MPLGIEIARLFVLALPVACISWTVTQEEVFGEAREYCVRRSKSAQHWYQRKFFYLFTCEYCFSHYVSAFFVYLAGYTLLLPGWRGYVIGWFALVWIANQYMSVFRRLRLQIKEEVLTIQAKEEGQDEPPRAGP